MFNLIYDDRKMCQEIQSNEKYRRVTRLVENEIEERELSPGELELFQCDLDGFAEVLVDGDGPGICAVEELFVRFEEPKRLANRSTPKKNLPKRSISQTTTPVKVPAQTPNKRMSKKSTFLLEKDDVKD